MNHRPYCRVFVLSLVASGLLLAHTARAADVDTAKASPNGRFIDAFVMATYRRTIERLDDDSKEQAQGIIQRDYANMRRQQIDLDQLEQDARQVLKLDEEYPGAHFLLGYVRYEEGKTARGSRDFRAEADKLQQAHASYTKAIDLLQHQEDPFGELAIYYFYRINAAVALAYAAPQVDRRVKLLEQAVQDAKASMEREPRYAVHAYAAMGNALEKLAWMVDGNADKFEKAVEALTTAREKSQRTVHFRIALGRCKYKAVEATVYAPSAKSKRYLDESAKEFADILKGDGQDFDRRLSDEEKAEVHYWTGRIAFLQGRFAVAETAFQEVLAVAPRPSGWRPLALESSADAELKLAERAKAPAGAEAQTHLQAARANATRLAAVNPAEAARIRAQALLIEGKPAEALDEIDQALPPKGQPAATISEIRLSLFRHSVLLDATWKAALRTAKRPLPDAPSLAREVAATSESASRYVALRGQAFANVAFARLDAMPEKEAPAERPKVVEYLRGAVRFTLPDDPTGRRCRTELERQLALSKPKEADNKN